MLRSSSSGPKSAGGAAPHCNDGNIFDDEVVPQALFVGLHAAPLPDSMPPYSTSTIPSGVAICHSQQGCDFVALFSDTLQTEL
jgi:hypothetical protein